jgi:TonB family protein
MKKVLLFAIGIMIALSANAQYKKKEGDLPGTNSAPQSYPEFPGGQEAFKLFLQKNLKYPDPQLDAQGRVIISFIVEKSGHLTHFKIERSLQEKFDKEALRVLKLSPNWMPAKSHGKPIRSQYTVPINFTVGE